MVIARIGLKALAHDRGKLASAVAGVAAASLLLALEIGLYHGFKDASSSLVRHFGGDVWVMARGTEVMEGGELLSPAVWARVEADPCFERARSLLVTHASARGPGTSPVGVMLVGVEAYEPATARHEAMPWSTHRGLPADLRGPNRVSVDASDVRKLHLPPDPLGGELTLGPETVHVAVVTKGIRSFTLQPYLFLDIDAARRVAAVPDGQVQYVVADMRSEACTPGFVARLNGLADLQAIPTEAFARMSEDYWVSGSGAGAALAFGAALGSVVGALIVGQALYSLTKTHELELATLKAMGASPPELVAFVACQAAFLAATGGPLGLAAAAGLGAWLSGSGLSIVLSPGSLLFGLGVVTGMCVLASVAGIRHILSLSPAEVFK